jgi:hypothetical protein
MFLRWRKAKTTTKLTAHEPKTNVQLANRRMRRTCVDDFSKRDFLQNFAPEERDFALRRTNLLRIFFCSGALRILIRICAAFISLSSHTHFHVFPVACSGMAWKLR